MKGVSEPLYSMPYSRGQASSNSYFKFYFWTGVAAVAVVVWNKARKISLPIPAELLLTAAAVSYVAYVVLFEGEDGEEGGKPPLPDFQMPDHFAADFPSD